MRKIIASLIVLAISFTSFAQDASSGPEFRKHRFGLKVTPGMAYFKTGKIGSKNKGLGYHVAGGLNYEYSLSKSVAISTGLLFAQTSGGIEYTDSVGLEFQVSDNGVTSTVEAFQLHSRRYVFNSIDIPLKFKFRTPEIGYLTYYGEFGATASIITKATAKKNLVTLTEGNETVSELSDNAAKLDANKEANFYRGGVNFGAGVEWNVAGNTSLLMGVNANLAFTNILKKDSKSISYKTTDESFQRATKLNYIALQIGVQF